MFSHFFYTSRPYKEHELHRRRVSLYITAYKGSNQKTNNKSKIVDGRVEIEACRTDFT